MAPEHGGHLIEHDVRFRLQLRARELEVHTPHLDRFPVGERTFECRGRLLGRKIDTHDLKACALDRSTQRHRVARVGEKPELRPHRAVESLTLDREVAHLKDSLGPRVAEMIYYGFWYTPEFEAIRALLDETQKNVNGTARLKLYKGNCAVVGRRSPNSLYSEAFATFERDTVYNQRDAEGFIKLNALRLRMRKMAETTNEEKK